MAIFLFLKQFVDMLYQWKWLDVVMVLAIVPMLMYQFILVRPDVKKTFCLPDGIILALIFLLSVSFLKDVVSYREYIKVLSAFLLFIVGRLYYDRILECDDALAGASYLIVYLNFIHRLITFGSGLLSVSNAEGDFYYYDTDMAFAMILSFVFIAMFAKKSVFKMITLIFICPYMIFFSDADIQKIVFLLVLIVIGLYFIDVALRKWNIAVIGIAALIIVTVALIALVYLPLLNVNSRILGGILGQFRFLSADNMATRYQEWRDVIATNWPLNVLQYLFGTKMNTTLPLKSLYLKIIYTVGIVGLLLSVVLMVSVYRAALFARDRKSFYIVVAIALLVLMTGITINSMETTQMSWFVMLFAGMAVSSGEKARNLEEKIDH